LAKKLIDKPIKFHFVGNQAENFRDYWVDLMENFPDNCVWHGERDDVEKFYKASDAFYFTSNLELNPLVIKEALSYGLPTFIKNLDTYDNEYDGRVNYIKNIQYENIRNLLNVLKIQEKKPRIQAIHLLTNTTHKREIRSINYISKLADYGIEYTQHINPPYDEIPPKNFCKRPHLISDKPKYLESGFGTLTGRHYGCFLAHINAIKSMNDDYDYTLIFEADANIEYSIDEFVSIIFEACNFEKYDDIYYVSFGNNPSRYKNQVNDIFLETGKDQDLSHAYLIPNKHKDWYLDKIEKVPWDGYDLWLNDVFSRYPKARYTTKVAYSNQIEGESLIDLVNKWETDKKTKPILIISSGRRTSYLEKTLRVLFEKNPNLSQKLKKVWLLDDRSNPKERSYIDELMSNYFYDNYNTINFNSNKPFDFVDKFNMIKKLINKDDIVFLLEDDWECTSDIQLEFHINNLIQSDWTQIAFCDPFYLQDDYIKEINLNDMNYWNNPFPNTFRHPIRWDNEIAYWVEGSINNWTNNPSLIKGEVFYRSDFKNIKNFEAEFANTICGNQVFTRKELFRHFGEDSLINKL
jgi:hypothetical protein